MKKRYISCIKYLLLYILIFVSVLSLSVGINANKFIQSINNLFTLLDYNIIKPHFNISLTSSIEESMRKMKEIEESEIYTSFIGDTDKIAEYYKALSEVNGFYVVFSSSDFALDILCSKLPHFPENHQMRYSYGEGYTNPYSNKYYDKLREKYNSGKDQLLQFCCMQVDYRIDDSYYMPLLEGELNDFNIKYSDYINTDKPIPVVIGYDLRDLFKLGDIIDASAVFAIPNDEVDEYYIDITNSNVKIEVIGILDQDAYALSRNSAGIKTDTVNTAIIMPFFDYTAGPYENKVDRTVFSKNYKSNAGCNVCVLTKMSVEKAEAEYMNIIDMFGLRSVYNGTALNALYVVKGISLFTYIKLVNTVFFSSLTLLAVALIGGIISSINQKTKKLSIHFLVGADKGVFFWKIILLFLITDIMSCLSVYIFFRVFSEFITEKFGQFLLEYNIISCTSVAMCAGIAGFIILIAIIKINRTDFSKALKEAKV